MKTFYGYGDTTIELYSGGKHIGTDYGDRPIYKTQAESLEAVKKLPLSAWEPTNASYGTMGAYFEEGFDYNDIDEEEIVLTYIYAIQEYNS